MRIGLDIDGVLADFNTAFAERLATLTGRTLAPAPFDPHVWDWPRQIGYTGDEVDLAWRSVDQEANFWRALPARTGAVTFLSNLCQWMAYQNWVHAHSHEVYFLTTRTHGIRVKDQTEAWLQAHGFGCRPPTVLITRGDKGEVAFPLGLTHAVDDRPENILAYTRAGGIPSERAVLFRGAYNAYHERDTGCPAVSTLAELTVKWGLQ